MDLNIAEDNKASSFYNNPFSKVVASLRKKGLHLFFFHEICMRQKKNKQKKQQQSSRAASRD